MTTLNYDLILFVFVVWLSLAIPIFTIVLHLKQLERESKERDITIMVHLTKLLDKINNDK